MSACTIEVLDQHGLADRFLSEDNVGKGGIGPARVALNNREFPTRHPYGLALWQEHIERSLAGWVAERGVPIQRGREVTGFTQDDSGVDIELCERRAPRAEYLNGCHGGRSMIRPAAGISSLGMR